MEEAFELNVTRLIERTNSIDLIEGPVNQMIVRNRPDLLIGENAPELTAPGIREIRVGATTGTKKESTMAEVLFQVGYLGVGKDKIIMSVHEQKRSFKKVRIGQPNLALLLDLESGGAGDQLHEVLPNAATIISVVGAVSYAPHEESGLLVVGGLGRCRGA